MDATVPPTDHSLPHLSICALVALLCHLFSTHCLAADVAFSSDNQRIYAVSSTDEGRTALREINLATNTARVIPLVELDDPKIYASSFTFDIACSDEGKILLVSEGKPVGIRSAIRPPIKIVWCALREPVWRHRRRSERSRSLCLGRQ